MNQSFKRILPKAAGPQLRRILTGFCLAALIAGCLYQGGAALLLAVLAAGAAGLWEFYGLFWPGRDKALLKICGLLCGAGIIWSAYADRAGLAILFLTLATLIAALAFLFDYGRGHAQVKLDAYALLPFGVGYVPLALSFGLGLTPREQVLVLLAVIASDTGAYYIGCSFGRRKIWPSVSPGKSWEGAIGGFCACILAGLLLAWFFIIPASLSDTFGSDTFGPDKSAAALRWLIICAAIGLTAQMGDFFESALKRAAGVKDSSALLPGHGGILDRIDGMLFAFPVYALLRAVFSPDARAALAGFFNL